MFTLAKYQETYELILKYMQAKHSFLALLGRAEVCGNGVTNQLVS